MPLEVRQIGIRMDVGDQAPPAAEGKGPGWPAEERPVGRSERAAIVRECVAAVLAELKLQGER
jgi:hypothetical protein